MEGGVAAAPHRAGQILRASRMVSHIVADAASIVHAASTALPPRENASAPAVAAKGLPAIAIQ
jgi:hypothetical protein